MKLIGIERVSGKKEFKATFALDSGKKKTTQFGTASNYVLNPAKTKKDRAAYIARHKVREDFNAPTTAGALSKHILWGGSKNLNKNIKTFKKKFSL
jgi:hypothetical protein